MTKDFDPITESPLQAGQEGEGSMSYQKYFRKKKLSEVFYRLSLSKLID